MLQSNGTGEAVLRFRRPQSGSKIKVPVPQFASAIETGRYLKPLSTKADPAFHKAGPAPHCSRSAQMKLLSLGIGIAHILIFYSLPLQHRQAFCLKFLFAYNAH